MDITWIVEIIISAVAIIIASCLFPWIRSRLTAEQQKQLTTFINDAVYAAGKLKETGFIADKGKYALEQIEAWLATRNIRYDTDQIKVMLEAAVKRLDLTEKEVAPVLLETGELLHPLPDEEGTYDGVDEVQ